MVSKLSLNSYKILNTYRSVLVDRGIHPSCLDHSKNKIGFSKIGNPSLAKLKKIAFETIEQKTNPVVITRVDMSRIVEMRKEQNNRMGFIPFVTCALVATLRESMGIYGTEVPTISIAVGTENRTLVSLLSSLKDFSLSHVEKRLKALSEEVQRGEFPLEPEGQKTFTIVNGGVLQLFIFKLKAGSKPMWVYKNV